jgi:hypothetical protein
MALMALFAGLASAQETTPPAPPGTNQAAVKPDSHVEAPNTYQVDLTGGRAKPKPTVQPASRDKQGADFKALPKPSFELFRNQADRLPFPPEQLGPAHAGIRTYARYSYIRTNMECQLRDGKPLSTNEQFDLVFDLFQREVPQGEIYKFHLESLLEVADLPAPTNPTSMNTASSAELTEAQIAAIGYLSFRSTLYESPSFSTDYKTIVQQKWRNYETTSPMSRLLHAGLTRSTLDQVLREVPLSAINPRETPFAWKPFRGWTGDIPIAQQMARAQRLMVLIYFTNDDSPLPFEREAFDVQEFADYSQKNLVPVRVGVFSFHFEGSPQRKLQRKYSVTQFPTVIVLNSNGAEVGRIGTNQPGSAAVIAALERMKADPALQAAQPPPEQPANPRPQRQPRRSGTPFR